MAVEKEETTQEGTTQVSEQGSDSIVGLATKVYKKGGFMAQFVVGIALILFSLSLTGTPLSTITDKRFGLQEVKENNTYNLQVKTFDYMKEEIKPQIDQILLRLENHEGRIGKLEELVSGIKEENGRRHIK